MTTVNEKLIQAFQESFIEATEVLFSKRGKEFDKSKMQTPEITIDTDKTIRIPKFVIYDNQRTDIAEDELKNFEDHLYNHLDGIMPELTPQ